MKRPYFATIWKKVGEAISDYGLIQDGDVIGVGVSGGKDSLLLLWVLSGLRKIAPVRFRLLGLTVEMGWPLDLSGVRSYSESLGVPFFTRTTNIWPIVFEQRREENPCALCAHLRRGALNSLANETGCNKVALAHHLDDAIETLLMSMFYEGRVQTFYPKTELEESGLTSIRPLIYVEEHNISRASSEMVLPVVKNPCPASGQTKRQEAKNVISTLAAGTPHIRNRMRSCLESLWKARQPGPLL